MLFHWIVLQSLNYSIYYHDWESLLRYFTRTTINYFSAQTFNTSIIATLLPNKKWSTLQMFTGIYRDSAGEIGVQGFQIYGDCMYTRNPCNIEISTLLFPCKKCRDFDFTGILWGYPTLNVGKSCKKIIFVDISVKFVGISCKF